MLTSARDRESGERSKCRDDEMFLVMRGVIPLLGCVSSTTTTVRPQQSTTE